MNTKQLSETKAPEDRKLAFGVYVATENFKAVAEHSCVCYEDDMGLVATTGPADDELSQKYAEFFAGAPARIAELEAALLESNNMLSECIGNLPNPGYGWVERKVDDRIVINNIILKRGQS
jgi:hypothetical protein